MCKKSGRIRRFLAADGGPTAVEYAVMLAFVVCVLYAAVASIGAATSGKFSAVRSAFTSAS
jgi:pilus assembly protein Flp/PilA